MNLLKMTADNANFQAWVKNQLHYLMDRAEKCKNYLSTQMSHKHQAGYFNGNVNKDAINFLRDVIANPDKPEPTSATELISRINQLDKADNRQEQHSQKPQVQNDAKQDKKEEEKLAKKSKIDPDIVKQIEDSILDQSPNV